MKRLSVDELLVQEDVVEAIAQAAGRVGRRYRAYISPEDLRQSGYLWVAQHPNRVQRELPDPDEDQRSQVRAYRRLMRLLERALEGVARAEKAAAEGYNVEDEVFYESALIEELLPTIWDPDAIHNPPQLDRELPRGKADPAEGNNWAVLVTDIRRAWEVAELDGDQRIFLSLRFGSNLSVTQVSEAMGASREATVRQIRLGVAALARALHGVRPLYLSEDDAPEEDDVANNSR